MLVTLCYESGGAMTSGVGSVRAGVRRVPRIQVRKAEDGIEPPTPAEAGIARNPPAARRGSTPPCNSKTEKPPAAEPGGFYLIALPEAARCLAATSANELQSKRLVTGLKVNFRTQGLWQSIYYT